MTGLAVLKLLNYGTEMSDISLNEVQLSHAWQAH